MGHEHSWYGGFHDRMWAAGRGRRRGGGGAGGGPFGFGGMPPGGGFPPGSPPFLGLPWSLAALLRRGARARRGDVRAAILALLAEEPRNGYQIMQELEQRSGGSWRPSPGSVYPALQQLEDERLVRAEDSAGGGRVFRLTDRGKAYIEEHKVELGAPWEAMSKAPVEESAFGLLFGEVRHIAAAAMQIAQTGGKAQIALAQKVLADARRDLYRLLADGDSTEDDE